MNLEECNILGGFKKAEIKKEDAAQRTSGTPKEGDLITSSVISIENFLEIVNTEDLAQDVFSGDILERLRMQRRENPTF